jgi:hypothetical protein
LPAREGAAYRKQPVSSLENGEIGQALAVGAVIGNSSLLRLFSVLQENTGKFVEFGLGTND